jgi:hypothetical protein
MSRRRFLGSMTALGAAGLAGSSVPGAVAQPVPEPPSGASDRAYWLAALQRIAGPVLGSLSRRELRLRMPVESSDPAARARFTHLEAFGRLMCGIAPWLATTALDAPEEQVRQGYVRMAQACLDAATEPASPDLMNFSSGDQPLVDTAFLAQGILRAPQPLWHELDGRVRRQVAAALKASRAIPTPTGNNWVLFAAAVEAALHAMGESTVPERLEACVHRMLGWYKGDGAFGDGESFHFDYYNSFVIHPLLIDVLKVLGERDSSFAMVRQTEQVRARRYAEVLERLIAPDGSFPSIGRSTAYRFGAFHALAQSALLGELPERIKPAQVRCAMTAVMRRSLEAPGTFDESGWLRIGFCGHQPSLGEGYISTGSLYLCSAALLPLGLAASDPFWSADAARWTSQLLWSGENLAADHAIKA